MHDGGRRSRLGDDPARLELLLDALDAHDDGVIVFDRAGGIQFANRAAEAMCDLRLDDAVGMRFADLADQSAFFAEHLEMYTIVDHVIAETMEAGGSHADDDASRIAPGGELIPVSNRLHAVRRDGEVVGAVFVIRDQGQHGSLMFRRAAVPMCHVSRRGNIREANQALVTYLGYDGEGELREQPFIDLVHPDDRGLAGPLLDEVHLGRSTSERARLRLVRRDGQLRWADASVAPNGLGGEASGGVGGVCAILQDVTEQVLLQQEVDRAHEQLRRLALHDALTGLPNRTKLADDLAEAQHRAAATGGHVAVLFIDLDGFKAVNDTGGHETGDWLLVQAGERLRRLLRPGDVAARFGGDEFVLCCAELAADPAAARAEAHGIADRVRAALGAPFELGGARWTVGASVGIALSRAGSDEPGSLLRAADAEMYRLKAAR